MKERILRCHVDHAKLAVKPLQVLITTFDFFDVNSLPREADVFPQTMI